LRSWDIIHSTVAALRIKFTDLIGICAVNHKFPSGPIVIEDRYMPLGVSPVTNPPGNSDVRVVVVDNMVVVVAGVENVVIDVVVDVEGVVLISVTVVVAGVEVVIRAWK